MTTCTIFVVRHGQTAANKDGIIQGQLDTPLDDTGYAQAQVVGEALKNIVFTDAYSSDLSRARDVGANP